jgi:hypothetical protein
MKITKQRLKEIIKEELNEIGEKIPREGPDQDLRRELRASSQALEKALKDFVTIRNYESIPGMSAGDTAFPGIPAVREFVDEWVKSWETRGGWQGE